MSKSWPYNTAAWRRLRATHLALHPLCQVHLAQGAPVRAEVVDHKFPISEGGHAFPDHDGLTSLCAACHNRKTARGPEAGAVRTSKPMRGCDANGWPFDPNHPWNRAPSDPENRSGLTAANRRPADKLNKLHRKR